MLKTEENIKKTLKEALSEIGVVTEQSLRKTLKDMNIVTKDDIQSEISASEKRVIRKLGLVKKDLAGRIAKLATTTPTLKQFDELKRKVDTYTN